MIVKSMKLSPKLFGEIDKAPTRNGFGDGLAEIGEKDERIVAICCDLTDSTKTKAFADKFPKRFVEAGVAEQNMMGMAAGMALEGKIPFVTSYAVFNPGRNWDQLRVSVCYSKANVKVIGAHAGISVGPDGATHQALEDLAITRVLPNMTVVAPADYFDAKKAIIALAKHQGPAYMRFGREKVPTVTTEETPFKIGRAEVYREGKDAVIVACGPLVYEALIAAEKMKGKYSIAVINSHTIKPLDKATILKYAKKTGAVVTAEEAQVNGGLGSAVSEVLSENYPVPMQRVGVKDTFGESGQPDELMDRYGLRSKNIITAINNVIKRK